MAEYTIDYNRGSDSNDGVTAPWKNLSKLAGTFADGDVIILNDESRWSLTDRVVIGTIGNRFTIERSGTNGRQKPTISFKFSVAANQWTYDAGNNGWYYDIGYTPGRAAWIRLGGAHYAQYEETGLPLESRDYAYCSSANRVYLYAPSWTTPTDYYGSVEIGPSDRGAITFSSDGTDVLLDGIRFEESGTGFLIYSNNGTRKYTLRRCETFDSTTLIFGSADTAGSTRYFVEDGDFEKAVCTFIHFYNAGGAGQGMHIIRRNRMCNSGFGFSQGAIYLQCRGGALVYDNDIVDAKWGTPGALIDGCGIYCETGSHDIVVFGNRIRNCHVALQDNSGRTTTWMGNIVENCYAAMRVGDQAGNNATKHKFLNNTCINLGYPIPTAGAANASNIGWRTIDLVSDDYTIVNNLFTKYTGSSDTQPAIETPASAAAGSAIANNLIYGFDATIESYLGGAASPTPTGTLTDNPLLDDNYRPMAGSPCIGAGIYIKGARHMGGLRLRSPADIGAYRYSPDLSTHANRSVATSRQITDSRRTTLLRPYR